MSMGGRLLLSIAAVLVMLVGTSVPAAREDVAGAQRLPPVRFRALRTANRI